MTELAHQENKKSQPVERPPEIELETAVTPLVLNQTLQRALRQPDAITMNDANNLQRTLGNRTSRSFIQRKLTVGPVGDEYEQEADAVAKQVVRRISSIQRQEEEEEVQMKPLSSISTLQRHHEEEDVQMKTAVVGAKGGDVSIDLEQSIQNARSGGQSLADNVREPMEQAFGADFGGVRIHANGQADGLNRSIQARAFTTGSDIFFRNGEYNPGSSQGQELLAHELTHVVQQNGVGVQRQSPNTICRCPACSGAAQEMLVQAKSVANVQQRSNGHHVGCNCGSCFAIQRQADIQVVSRHHDEDMLQAKRLHTVQKQAAAPMAVQHVRGSGTTAVVQRHSSWEHQLLGDVPPDKLSQIGTWQDLLKQTEETGSLWWKKRAQEEGEVDVEGVGKIKKGNVMHVIAQELQRLNDWQEAPPQGATAEDKEKLLGKDPAWDVVLVSLPVAEGEDPLIVTYGEMNTLADFYGDLETMSKADRTSRYQIIQSVRQETFFRLKDIYTQLQNSLTKTEKKDEDVQSAEAMVQGNKRFNQKLGYKFSGAVAPDYISGMAGQLELLKGVQSTGTTGETNQYGATLARNACHFVPESWHAWAGYHKEARRLAQESWNKRQQAQQLMVGVAEQENASEIEEQAQVLNQEADSLSNEALLNNGFGDHYLQDSYASGHMINKTQIMQWYVEYIDVKKEWDYFTDANWRKVQQMAYKQPGLASAIQYDKSKVEGVDTLQVPNKPRNPQSVESMKDEDWKVRFDALGLAVPTSLQTKGSDARKLMEWWQTKAGTENELKQSGANLLANSPLKENTVALGNALKSLILDGIIHVDGVPVETHGLWMGGRKNLSLTAGSADLNGLYVPKGNKSVFTQFSSVNFILRSAYKPKDMGKFAEAQEEESDEKYQRMAASVTYGDYFEFMKSGFIQKATNALHDTFCKGGLDVYSGDTEQLFRVYGDDAMMSAGSAAGVKHSAETANMSRDAILNIANSGGDQGKTTASIVNRLPAAVSVQVKDDKGKVTGTVKTDIAKWHNPDDGPSLKKLCFDEIFPSMSWSIVQKFAPGVMGSELGTISRDESVHGSEAF
ncbi:MAG: DUF4157 domain-containing protein [Ardenticatenaceae bacterium]|nr:DUF4157 domain-containing protein [Anaerolineales bacterium]MCB8920849.1 DUF4157 domain-containing protein [Ardenticatenaceae bacterium]MCB9002733.1 DUF4157 domain-containing protein [Ardenticatenaceae bacterium]